MRCKVYQATPADIDIKEYNWQCGLLGHLVSVGWFLAELPTPFF